jgi:hypothetical protein
MKLLVAAGEEIEVVVVLAQAQDILGAQGFQ